jgi:hypothetical protein
MFGIRASGPLPLITRLPIIQLWQLGLLYQGHINGRTVEPIDFGMLLSSCDALHMRRYRYSTFNVQLPAPCIQSR